MAGINFIQRLEQALNKAERKGKTLEPNTRFSRRGRDGSVSYRTAQEIAQRYIAGADKTLSVNPEQEERINGRVRRFSSWLSSVDESPKE